MPRALELFLSFFSHGLSVDVVEDSIFKVTRIGPVTVLSLSKCPCRFVFQVVGDFWCTLSQVFVFG